MSWEASSLWAKSCSFFEKAFAEKDNDPVFCLWASFGLELLVRSSLSSISPILLAEQDKEFKYVLYAIGKNPDSKSNRSIGTSDAIRLCTKLFPDFTEDDQKNCTAIISRRNDELHTGSAAFEEYPSSIWLAQFYKACKTLCRAQDKSLEDLFSEDEAESAEAILLEKQKEVKSSVLSKIASYKKVFFGKDSKVREEAVKEAEVQKAFSSSVGHGKPCPSCDAWGLITGLSYGEETVEHSDGEIIVRQAMRPRKFHCTACGLSLFGYAELEAANMGGRYNCRQTTTPEDYYGLVSPSDDDDFDPYFNE